MHEIMYGIQDIMYGMQEIMYDIQDIMISGSPILTIINNMWNCDKIYLIWFDLVNPRQQQDDEQCPLGW